MIEDYFELVESLLRQSPIVRAQDVQFDKRTSTRGYIRGNVFFKDSSMLHFREFISTGNNTERFVYVYYYQNANGGMVFRYDNSEHYPELSSAPHHKHTNDGHVVPSDPPDLQSVLREIEGLIDT